jgi:hypothetical protein
LRLLAFISSLLLAGPLLAGAALVLEDGNVLQGEDVRREGGLYLLEQEDGNVVSIPLELVREVRLTTPPAPDPRTGLSYREGSETLAGTTERPAGVRVGKGQTVAGDEPRVPTRAEQTAVLGPPSKFSRDIVDHAWTPSSDWDMDPGNNNFNPSKWSKSVVDNDWEPSSDWDNDVKNNDFNPSKWSQGVVDNEWQPKDGFAKD